MSLYGQNSKLFLFYQRLCLLFRAGADRLTQAGICHGLIARSFQYDNMFV